MLAVSATGCATSSLLDKYHETTSDTFTPFTVYSTTNYNNFAFEGNLAYANGNPSLRTFMMFPQGSSTNFQGEIISRTKIGIDANYGEGGLKMQLYRTLQHLPASVSTNMIQTNSLPPYYYKFSDIYPNMDRPAETVDGTDRYSDKIKFGIKEYHSSRGVIVFIPFTVVIDVATSPIQIPYYLLISWAMANSHGC